MPRRAVRPTRRPPERPAGLVLAFPMDAIAVLPGPVGRGRSSRWTDVGRVAIWHRIGRLELTEVSVIVAVSSPHRPVAFEAARFAIDALKVSAPIWKHEEWSEGADWGTGASLIEDPRNVASESN